MATLARFIAMVLVLGAAAGFLLQGPVHAASMTIAAAIQHDAHSGAKCDGPTYAETSHQSHHDGDSHSSDTMSCASACLFSAVVCECRVAIAVTKPSLAGVSRPVPAGIAVPGLLRPPRGI